MTRLRWMLAAMAVLLAMGCALLILRTVADWRADALRWRAASPAAIDTLAVQAALAARDTARAREARAGARLDSALAAWARRPGARSGERRGAGRTGESPVTVAPPADTGTTCDELADACAAFRREATARAAADSVALATERAAAQALVAATRRERDAVAMALADTVRALRPRWWRPSVVVGAACVASGVVTCGPSVALGWRIR